jgi:hypothetical protein
MALDVNATRVEALFCSTVQPSEKPDGVQVAESIAAMARSYGTRWCAARVAQEFGDHPDTAVQRMVWARDLVAGIYRGCRDDRQVGQRRPVRT